MTYLIVGILSFIFGAFAGIFTMVLCRAAKQNDREERGE